MTRRLILLVASIALLAGCGFGLRGNIALHESLSPIAVIGDDLELIARLEDALESNGVTITDKDNKTATILNLSRSQYQRAVRTTDNNGVATAYTLRYKLEYEVAVNGDSRQPNQKLSQSRVLQYDPLQQLQAEQEEQFLRQQMQQEIVLQLLRRLNRI